MLIVLLCPTLHPLAALQDFFADMSELFDDIGIDPMLFFMMSGRVLLSKL